MNILVLNVGSSTLKFQLIDTSREAIEGNADRRLARGQVERIGGEAVLTLEGPDGNPRRTTASLRDHAAAIEYVLSWMTSEESDVPLSSVAEIEAVGHRVVHG